MKKILTGIFITLISLATFTLTSLYADDLSITYDFNSETELDDFKAYLAETESSVNENFVSPDMLYDLNTSEGAITSTQYKGQGSGSTGNIAFLTLNKYVFKNLELDLVLRFAGTTWGWGGIALRQDNPGSSFRADGILAFAQTQGMATLWGSADFGGDITEGKKPSSFSSDTFFNFNVRLIGTNITVKVQSVDKTITYSEIEKTLPLSSVKEGFISIASIDNIHQFDKLTVQALDDDGNKISPKTSPQINQIKDINDVNIPVGKGINLEVYDENDEKIPNYLLRYSIDDDSKVSVNQQGYILGAELGNAVLKVSSVFDSSIYIEVNINITIGGTSTYYYDFTKENSTDSLTTSYVESASKDGGETAFSDYWIENTSGIKRINLPTYNSSDENIVSLYLKGRKFSNFEVTVRYLNSNQEYGWIGVTSGITTPTKRFIDSGQGFFIQKEGIATMWGNQINGPFEKGVAGYDISKWHTMRVKVYGKTAEIYIDNMDIPAFAKTFSTDLVDGDIGVFTSGPAEFIISTLSINYLDNQGNVLEFIPLDEVSIKNKISVAKKGDIFELDVDVIPSLASIDDLVVETDNSNIAFYNNGKIYFINAGKVNINIYSASNPSISDQMEVTVTKESVEELKPVGRDEDDYDFSNNQETDITDIDKNEVNNTPLIISISISGAILLISIVFLSIQIKKRKEEN